MVLLSNPDVIPQTSWPLLCADMNFISGACISDLQQQYYIIAEIYLISQGM